MNFYPFGILIYLIMCLYAAEIFKIGYLMKNTNNTDTLLPPFDGAKLPLLAVAKKANSQIGNLLFFLSAVFFIHGCICLVTGTALGKTFTVLSTIMLVGGIVGFLWMLIYYLKKSVVSV